MGMHERDSVPAAPRAAAQGPPDWHERTLCVCGCGTEVTGHWINRGHPGCYSRRNNWRPARFVRGHNGRVTMPPALSISALRKGRLGILVPGEVVVRAVAARWLRDHMGYSSSLAWSFVRRPLIDRRTAERIVRVLGGLPRSALSAERAVTDAAEDRARRAERAAERQRYARWAR